jgi:hypothetical protein
MPMRDRPSSSGLFPALRLVVGIGGAILLALGLVLTAVGVPLIGLIVVGGIGVVAAIWERTRYRSEAAERASAAPGPGGGEPAVPLEPRFRPTEERFVDPTSGRVMRVYADPASGERRYLAES